MRKFHAVHQPSFFKIWHKSAVYAVRCAQRRKVWDGLLLPWCRRAFLRGIIPRDLLGGGWGSWGCALIHVLDASTDVQWLHVFYRSQAPVIAVIESLWEEVLLGVLMPSVGTVGDCYIRISKGKFSLLPMIGLISDLYRIKRSGRRNKNRNRLDLLAQHE
jgi:hypothetical protein